MNDHFDKTIGDLQIKLANKEKEIAETKQLINLLCKHAGKVPIYAESALNPQAASVSIASDEFYGQPLTTAMRSILEKRKLSGNGPATPQEIYQSLLEGGYEFESEVEENRLISLRASLRKSSRVFHRLPNRKQYGLLEWYPKINKSNGKNETEDGGDEAEKEVSNTELSKTQPSVAEFTIFDMPEGETDQNLE